MVGKERGALVELFGVELLDCPSDRRVHAVTPTRELRLIGNLVRQRVLEGVLGFREQAFLEDELPVP